MHSTTALLFRNLRFHWAANVPVAVGVMIAAAVLTGALVVGDSLKGSLRARAERQLNGVTAAYIGPRMVREALAKETGTTPALLLAGSVRAAKKDGTEKRLGRATVLGLPAESLVEFPNASGAVLSARVAERLGAAVGDDITLGVQKMSAVPRSSLLGKRSLDDVGDAIKLKVSAILPADDPANDFNLTPNPEPPLNVFVPLAVLQSRLELKDKVNALLAYGQSAEELNAALRPKLDLADFGLRVKAGPFRDAYVNVESDQLILDPATVADVEKAAGVLKLRSERTLVYLANTISPGDTKIPNMAKGKEESSYKSIPKLPYSMIACVDPAAPAPLGPFLPDGRTELKDDEIALLDWPESSLRDIKLGSPLTVAYFKPEMEAEIEEAWATFKFAGLIRFAGQADDPNLTPPFPGITDKPKIRGNKGEQWEAPFEINYARIGGADDDYWERHRATPKAYITRAAGEKLFRSRFGEVTSIRVAPPVGETPEATAQRLRGTLLTTLDPATTGLQFQPLRERFLTASKGGTDFGMMLLAFSGLLILAAVLLVAMLFRLAIDRRAKEVGLLLATGYSPRKVRTLLLGEAGIVAAVGAVLGVGLAVVYARGMLKLLADLWPDANVQSYLNPHVSVWSLLIGFEATCLVATAAIWFGVRALSKVPPPQLLRGQTSVPELGAKPVTPKRSAIFAVVFALLGLGLVVGGGWVGNADMRAGSFFGGGFFLLLAGVFLFRAWLRRTPGTLSSVPGLGLRNATRSASRSMLTVSLLSLATFLLVAVESFRKKPGSEFAGPNGGSGGYPLIAEADVPVFQPFDRKPGDGDLLSKLQDAFGGTSTDPRFKAAKADLAAMKPNALPFRLRGGDDASCLNLYQAGKPRVLGVPDELIGMNRFAFAMTEAETSEEKANPWLLLSKPRDDGSIPIFVEQNTAMWMLKTFIGGTVKVPDETGREVTLRIVGTLQDSVFQSELLVSDANFRKLYPREEGFRLFLVDAPADKLDRATELLETGLRGNGLIVSRTADKVAAYQAVIGAYLTTFQLLGGLALLLGVCGLGVVILRGVWERQGELAVLRAVGYRPGTLVRLVLVENLLLLVTGLGVGLVAAVVSVIPNLQLGGQFDAPRLGALLGAVFAVGLVVAVWATGRAAKVPLIPALRTE